MIIINKSNPKIMRNLILGRGYNKNIFKQININKNNLPKKNNKINKLKQLPNEQKLFLKSLINKTGKGFKKI
jgi:hypothetical protein